MSKSETPTHSGHPWRRAIAWGCFLGPFFFLSYGFANDHASRRSEVAAFFFEWERSIPFLAWTIVPYWSIDFLYGVSAMLCTTRRELDAHVRRLITVQLVSVACFLVWPLRFAFERPETSGLSGYLFDQLAGFDKPFNQAPSLHMGLLVIIWARLAAHVPRWLLWPLHAWMTLIGVSVLTTYQHHFIDVPTGVLSGFACLWLWPIGERSPLATMRLTHDPKRRKLAAYYGAGALVFGGLASLNGGTWLWLWWPAVSSLLVSLCYLVLGVEGFQKSARGTTSPASRWLFAPYRLGAWLNSRLWTRGRPASVHVVDQVWLGRIHTRSELARSDFKSVVDLTGELHVAAPDEVQYHAVPALDLVTPSESVLREAAAAIAAAPRPVLVCCALGYSRSASAVAAWLLHTGHAESVAHAVSMIERVQPRIVLAERHREALERIR